MVAILELRAPQAKPSYAYGDIVSLLPEEKRMLLHRDDSLADTTRQLYLWLSTQAGYHLDAVGVAAMLFLVSRTYGFYKRAELVSRRHLTEGAWSERTGESVGAPPFSNDRSMRRTMDFLAQKGYVTSRRITVNGADVASLIELHAEKILADRLVRSEKVVLRVGKKHRNAAEMTPEAGQSDAFLGRKTPLSMSRTPLLSIDRTEYKNKRSKENSSASRRKAGADEINFNSSAKDVIAAVALRSRTSLENRAAKANKVGKLPAYSDLNAAWTHAMVTVYGSAATFAVFTHREYGILKRTSANHALTCSWSEFISWSVRNWRALNQQHLDARSHVKDKKGEWSLGREDTVHLGSDHPDTAKFAFNFAKLVKAYAGRTLSVAAPESKEVLALRAELADARRTAAVATNNLQRVMRSRPSGVTPPKRSDPARVNIVDPETDTFFNNTDTDVPEWK